jgi:hypothetical protein
MIPPALFEALSLANKSDRQQRAVAAAGACLADQVEDPPRRRESRARSLRRGNQWWRAVGRGRPGHGRLQTEMAKSTHG